MIQLWLVPICEMVTAILRVVANDQQLLLAAPKEIRDKRLARDNDWQEAAHAVVRPLLRLIAKQLEEEDAKPPGPTLPQPPK